MTEMGIKNLIKKRVLALEAMFEKRYELYDVHMQNRKCFRANDAEFFMVTGLNSFGGIVIEHAFSEYEAQHNMFEDGDLFYLDEMDEEEMFEAMIREIEDN